MLTRYKKQNFFHGLLLPCLVVCILVYFFFHASSGRYGLRALEAKNVELQRIQRNLDILSNEKNALIDKIKLFDEENIDGDIVDERARKMLGYIGSHEVIIYYSK